MESLDVFVKEKLALEEIKAFKKKSIKVLASIIIASIILVIIFSVNLIIQNNILFNVSIFSLFIILIIYSIYLLVYKNNLARIIFDFYKKDFEKIEFNENEKKLAKKDFENILLYDKSIILNNITFNNTSINILDITKINLNDKQTYIAYHSDNNGKQSFNFDLFTNVNTKKRFYVYTKNKKLIDMKENVLNFDKKYFKKIQNKFSKEFYLNKFSQNAQEDYLESEEIKEKLIDIFKKYNINFSVAIKDNLLRINLKSFMNDLENELEFLYKIKNMTLEILDIFLKLEKEEEINVNG